MSATNKASVDKGDTIDDLRAQIDVLTNSASTMCGRAEEQKNKMEDYVEKSAVLDKLLSALDKIISSKDSKLGFKEMFDRLMGDLPKHQQLMSVMHKDLMILQQNQHEISTESTEIAHKLVNLNIRNHRAHVDANAELEKKIQTSAMASELMIADKKISHALNVVVSNEFIEKVRIFVGHVDMMVHCKIEKEKVFQIICAEIDTVKVGVDQFDAHVKSPARSALSTPGISEATPSYRDVTNRTPKTGGRNPSLPRQNSLPRQPP